MFTAFLAILRFFRPRETVDWPDPSAPGRIATISGVGVHYTDQGSGPAVVLVHGFGAHAYTFRHIASDLSRDHRVVALDMKGFGYSERPRRGDYSLSAQARLVLGLMDVLGIERASLIGHSLGGEVVMRAASMAQARVERLVLAASVSGDRVPTLPVLPIVKPLISLFGRLFARRFFRRMFYDSTLATEETLDAYRAPARIRGTAHAVYQLLRDSRREKAVDSSRIRQPVLVLWASHERILPRWTLGRLRKRFPRAEVVSIGRAGHVLLEERPQESLAAIRPFLRASP